MSLTDTTIKNAKPTDKPYKIADEKGLFLLVNPNGSKYFRLKYRFGGKEKLLALGVYPETTLKMAREKRDAAKNQIANGIDPSDTRKEAKTIQRASLENEKRLDAGLAAIDSFEFIALEWYDKNMLDKSESHQKRTMALFNKDLFPWLGRRPINEIKPAELLKVLQRIESRNAIETAHRALQLSGQVFRYAEITERADRDISQSLKGALTKVTKGHFAAITEPKEAGRLLRDIDAYKGTFTVKCALQLAPLFFVRPSELRLMEWEHLDFDTREWRYFVTKTKSQHIVPLCKQSIEILGIFPK
jgi:hypothetical protein